MPLGSRPPELDRLTKEFCIVSRTPTSASLTLPPGCSRFNLIERAHNAVHQITGADLIDSDLLDEWRHNPFFSESYNHAVHISVHIHRDGNLSKKRDEHEAHLKANGQEIATEEDTATAFAAFFVKRGIDLFNDDGVQTDYRGLRLNDEGLVDIEFYKTVAVAVAGLPGQPTRQIGRN